MMWTNGRQIIKKQRQNWHDYFALWPVKVCNRLTDGQSITAWLEIVERRLTRTVFGNNVWEYRIKGGLSNEHDTR